MANFIASLKAVLSLDNKEFSNGLKKSQQQVKEMDSDFAKLGKTMASAFSVGALIAFYKQMAKMNRDIYNAQIAFERMTYATNLNMNLLRGSTGNMISDLKLMQQTVQALNLNLRASDLPSFFKFATIRAAETGVSVDYLVNSIVTGVGRQSRLVLDNLGISLVALNREIAKTGNFMEGAVNIINRELEKSGRTVQDSKSGIQELTAALENLVQVIAESKFGEDLEYAARFLADFVRSADRFGDTAFGKYVLWAARGGVAGSIHRYLWFDDYKDIQKSNEMIRKYHDNLENIVDLYGRMEDVSVLPTQFGDISEPTNIFQEVLPDPFIDRMNAAIDVYKNLRDISTSVDEYTKWNNAVKVLQQYLRDLGKVVELERELVAIPTRMQSRTFTGEHVYPTADPLAGLGPEMFEGLNQKLYENAQAFVEASAAGKTYGQTLANLQGPILDLEDSLQNALGNAIAVFADSIGQLIGGDTENALATFINGIAGLMKQFGALLIAWGVAQIALKASIANPYVAIAAGAALVAIGGLMSAKGGQVTGSASSSYGGSYSGYAGNYGGAFDYNREIVMVARGDDLVGIINRKGFDDGVNL